MAILNSTEINGDLIVRGTISGNVAVEGLSVDSAEKLTCGTRGEDSIPVYFKDGEPVACTNIQPKLIAGTGITIDSSNTISCPLKVESTPSNIGSNYPLIMWNTAEEKLTHSSYANSKKIVGDIETGKIIANSFNALSDARLKENFDNFIPSTSILDLPVYKFDFIDGAKNQIGCKAQDLQKICPELVDQDIDGYLSIQESKLIYLLLQEVKNLKAYIEDIQDVV